MPDTISRFTFDDNPLRGEFVQLEHSYQELLAIHHYPPVVAGLLGELSAAASLLAETIKFDGTLTLQVRSEGEIPLLMAEISNQQHFRAIARRAEHASSTDFATLFHKGQLCLTIQPRLGKPYQGIVALNGNNLASSFDDYFAQSEQLPTRIFLCADGERAAGFLLQQMPVAAGESAETQESAWSHLSQLAATLKADELLQLPREELLYRLYHQEALRLHLEKPVQFQCTCSRERLEQVLESLGRVELDSILDEKGLIDVNCEFCNRFYSFSHTDVAAIFGDGEGISRH
ncbi:MAG: molecular chaperone Hsp33 [Bacteroidia bacterium]|jgi:molecular chaperone Hsp33